jgi:hypothetical protein
MAKERIRLALGSVGLTHTKDFNWVGNIEGPSPKDTVRMTGLLGGR